MILHFRENVNISSQLAQLTEKATNLTAENDKLAVSKQHLSDEVSFESSDTDR